MPNYYGPHLLGRVAPEPDKRDFLLSDYFDKGVSVSGDDLDRTLSALLNVKGAAQTTKDWAKAITSHVRNLENAVGPQPAPVSAVLWDDSDVVLDQGDTPHCVGFGSAQWGNTKPVQDHFVAKDGHAIYYECKTIDGEPKAEDGTSVHSAAKALKARKRLNVYAWAQTLTDIKTWTLTKGPVIIGSDWTADMFNPDGNGFVKPTGVLEGGHCYLVIGWDDTDVITFLNSWSAKWGKGGRFHMTGTEFNKLVNRPGFEAMAAVELP